MTHRTLRLITSSLLLAFASSTAASAALQLVARHPEAETAAGGKVEFDVASVKPSPAMTPFSTNIGHLDGLDGPDPKSTLFEANAPLMGYLLFAYSITDSVRGRAIYDHLPDWARSQFFSVEGRAARVPTRDQLRLMVQALLADRFKLAVHREMQTRNEYALTLVTPGKLGPQLQHHPATEPCIDNPSAALVIQAPTKATSAPRYCGMVTWNIEGQHHLRLIDVTPAQIANYLASASMSAGGSIAPHAGVDGTGLTGRFDLDLQFTPEDGSPDSNIVASGPGFEESLKHQLGLKLVERKGPVEVLVIDHLEKPSEN